MFNSDEMEIVRRQTITRLAQHMARGELSMPRSKFDYIDILKIEFDQRPPNMFNKKVLTAHCAFKTSAEIYHVLSESMSETEVNGHDYFSDAAAALIQRVASKSEALIEQAISDAHIRLRQNFRVPPLFVLEVRKESVKSLYDFLVNTNLHEGAVAGIRSLTEMNPQDTSYLLVSDHRVSVLDWTKFQREKTHAFDLTPILNFVSCFRRENIPVANAILDYHKHSELVKRYTNE